MEVKLIGAEEALKKLDRAAELIKELKDIIYGLGNLRNRLPIISVFRSLK